jgi:hypothetical protein
VEKKLKNKLTSSKILSQKEGDFRSLPISAAILPLPASPPTVEKELQDK